MSTSQLRQCPYCHQNWPHGSDYDLRGGKWLDPLPRRITVSNGDLFFHDGFHNRDRFLLLEIKMPWEGPIQVGQSMLLRAQARQPNTTVRIVRGRLPTVALHRVTEDGVDPQGTAVSASAIQASVADYLNGERWFDPQGEPLSDRVLFPVGTPLTGPRPCPSCHGSHPVGTTCAGGLWPWEPAP